MKKENYRASWIGLKQQKEWPGLGNRRAPRQNGLREIGISRSPGELARRCLGPGTAAQGGEEAQVGAINVGVGVAGIHAKNRTVGETSCHCC